ncbi:MAG: DUF1254 domain-containing protein [Tannerellaceae bacterium]|nr:DUF1254 domain-containing protein [Tannerellaceae bacterium]
MEESPVSIIRQAYLFAMPLVYMDVTRASYSIPDNYFYTADKLPDYNYKNVVAVNIDTNYSIAFLKLEDGPVLFEIPDMGDRYYTYPIMDAWTNNFIIPGTRLTGNEAQKYFVSGPDWVGQVPAGYTHIVSPTNLAWIDGRVQVNSPEDLQETVLPLQNSFKLVSICPPQTANRPSDKYLPDDFGDKSVVEVIKELPIEDYFNYFNELLELNVPFAEDSVLVRKMQIVGIGAGKTFSLSDFDAETQQSLQSLTTEIYTVLDAAHSGDILFGVDTTHPDAQIGDYKTDYNLRAIITYKGLGALPPQEAVYYTYFNDADGGILDGSQASYTIHFDVNSFPPAQAFWSYTIYNAQRYLVQNPIDRYAIGDRNELIYNEDGSLDIYLSYEAPADELLPNWLPIPNGLFDVTARIYMPESSLLNDPASWNDPKPVKLLPTIK